MIKWTQDGRGIPMAQRTLSSSLSEPANRSLFVVEELCTFGIAESRCCILAPLCNGVPVSYNTGRVKSPNELPRLAMLIPRVIDVCSLKLSFSYVLLLW
jgi:hypothetical protein